MASYDIRQSFEAKKCTLWGSTDLPLTSLASSTTVTVVTYFTAQILYLKLNHINIVFSCSVLPAVGTRIHGVLGFGGEIKPQKIRLFICLTDWLQYYYVTLMFVGTDSAD